MRKLKLMSLEELHNYGQFHFDAAYEAHVAGWDLSEDRHWRLMDWAAKELMRRGYSPDSVYCDILQPFSEEYNV